MSSRRLTKLTLSSRELERDLTIAKSFSYADSYSEFVNGRWATCMLWNKSGSPRETTISSYSGPATETADGSRLKYIRELVHQTFRMEHLRFARLVDLKPASLIAPHRDFVELSENFARIHIALATDGRCFLGEEETVFHISKGEVWFLDASRPHSAASFSENVRTHLILDFAPVDSLGDLFNVPLLEDSSGIPVDAIIHREPLQDSDLNTILGLSEIIDLDNYRDILALLTRKFYRKDVHIGRVFAWLEEIALLSRNTQLITEIATIENHMLIERRAA